MAATDTKVTVELCRSNSIGRRYLSPSVVEIFTVTRKEADRLLVEKRPNGYFVREQQT